MNNPKAPAFRIRNWRVTLIGALVGLLIALAMAMKWLAEFQVEAAEERRSLEAIARAAQMRCFELASHRATEACRAAAAAKQGAAP
ncbi:general secretion pathway protein GspL [Variovorax sp. Root318D1]|uniref:hypothetical protein n=1 Tax=Variovorax sp. Root318D1 TaxID=1736513 RepID=UPI0006F4A621|nr:hypothetical protein [Variovorax sp. Root318D1]KQU85112.1 general secretion pathway protein GspL [Variovorax sp. Root318D1]